MNKIYLDHNATTAPSPQVIADVSRVMAEFFGNPSSQHWAGQDAKRILDVARARASKLIGSKADEIVFTSGATESNNTVFAHVAALARKRSVHVVTSAIEHSSVLNSCAALEQQGVKVTYVQAAWDGRINARQIEAAFTPETVLVSVMLANNDTGVIQPIADIAVFAHARGILVHTDAVQAAGRILLDVKTLGVDFLSLSAHKFCGPRGVGVLYVKSGIELVPLMQGGKQETARRAGTENIPGIAGLGVAAEQAQQGVSNYTQRCVQLRSLLQQGILKLFPDARVYGETADRVANTLSMGFPGVDGMALMLNLDIEGIAISIGSACGAGDHEPSHVHKGMGCTEEDALSVVRFSLGPENTEEEIDATLAALGRAVPRLRSMRVK